MNRQQKIISGSIMVVLLSMTACSIFSPGRDERFDVITPALLRRYVDYLASDAMMGRNTPSPQLDSAAQFLAGEFEIDGLEPVHGSYFQQFGLGIVNLGDDNRLRITKDGKEQQFALKDDFVPFEMTANREVSGPVVFAGYGITAPEYQYDDYAGIDVRGKIVVVLRHEPREDDPNSPFEGEKATQYSNTAEKARIALEHGAAGLLVVTDPLNHGNLKPRGFPWPSLSRTIPVDALPISLNVGESEKIPVVHIGPAAVTTLFGSIEALRLVQARIDSTMTPQSFLISSASVIVKTSTVIKKIPARNVVGYCEGSDPELKKEILVIGAHFDHLGYKKGVPAGQDSIYNGADDNASGTAGMLALAKAFGTMSQKPKRSILFIGFSGEEEGLLGSQAYVDKPLFPLAQTVAMLNLDMIGRNTIDSLYLVGYSRSPDITRIAQKENRSIGFKLGYTQERFISSGDHGPFLEKKIPFLFFHTGLHGDYHQLTDEPSRINSHKAARVAQLVYRTALHIANEGEHYHVTSK